MQIFISHNIENGHVGLLKHDYTLRKIRTQLPKGWKWTFVYKNNSRYFRSWYFRIPVRDDLKHGSMHRDTFEFRQKYNKDNNCGASLQLALSNLVVHERLRLASRPDSSSSLIFEWKSAKFNAERTEMHGDACHDHELLNSFVYPHFAIPVTHRVPRAHPPFLSRALVISLRDLSSGWYVGTHQETHLE